MSTRRGTSLASLLLLVGTAGLLSGMARSIVANPPVLRTPRPNNLLLLYMIRIPIPSDEGFLMFVIALSVLTGLLCGINLAIRREFRIRYLLISAIGGCLLGALAGWQLVSEGDLGMVLLGSLALVTFGFVIRCSAAPAIRSESEIEWFRRDGVFDGPAAGRREP